MPGFTVLKDHNGLFTLKGSLVAQMTKNPPAMWETWVRSLGQEDPLQGEMLTTPIILPIEFHRQRSPVGYSPWDRKQTDMTEQLTLSSELWVSPVAQ